jgi:hypothetical protein
LPVDVSKLFEVHVDCDFASNWVKEDAMNNPSTAKSGTRYIISYAVVFYKLSEDNNGAIHLAKASKMRP